MENDLKFELHDIIYVCVRNPSSLTHLEPNIKCSITKSHKTQQYMFDKKVSFPCLSKLKRFTCELRKNTTYIS